MTSPVPHWPGRMVTTRPDEQVWLAETPRAGTPHAETHGGEGPSAAAERRELVLCVHGMSGAATNWTDFMAELAPEFDCAAVDLPGSGHSPPPRTPAGYRIGALAGTVIRLIETLGAGPVHLVGNSMGGAVSVRVAARRPDLIRTLTLVSPALPDLRVRRSVAHFPLLALPLLGEWMVRQWAARYPAENRVMGVYAACYHDPGRLHPDRFALEVAALRQRDGLAHDATALARAARTLVLETMRPAPFSLWRAAGRVTAPSLVLFGEDDRLVNPRLAGRASRAFRGARVEVLPEAGHIAQMERPDVVAGLFRELAARAREAGNSGRRDPVDA